MIKELNELVWYAEKSLWRDETLLAFLSRDTPEVQHLYSTLKKHNFRTDEEAAKCAGIGLTSFKKYGKLLKDSLWNMTLFFNDEKAKADFRVKNVIGSIKYTAIAKILLALGYRAAGREVAEKLLRKGLEFDCPEFVVDAALMLKECSARTSGCAADFEQYARLHWQYKEWLDMEQLAWEYYLRITLPYQKKVGVSGHSPERTKRYVAELAPYLGQVPSFKFHLCYFLISNHYCLEVFDYEGLKKQCGDAIFFFNDKKYPVSNPLSIFYYMKVVACTYMGRYEEGRIAAEASLRLASEGGPNYFKALEAWLYLAIHTRNYGKAFELHQMAFRHKRLATTPEAQQETWRLFGAYCYILHHLSGTPLPESFPQFKSARFLNDVQHSTQDKDGKNIAVLIAHVLLQLIEGKDMEVWDRVSALGKYRERHLLDDPYMARSQVFIKILLTMVKAGYQRDVFLQKAAPFCEELRTLPLRSASQAHELEIIPYEHLVELIAGLLGKRGLKINTPVPLSWPGAGREDKSASLF